MLDMGYDKTLLSEDRDYRFGLYSDGSAEIIKSQGNGVSIEIPEDVECIEEAFSDDKT